MGKKVVITGASGFLGSHIADALSKEGHAVTIIDKMKSPYLREDQHFIQGDIQDLDFLIENLKGMDAVYHLAALADLNEAKSKPIETVKVNVLGTVNMLEASRVNNIKRFVFGSTVYVYSREGGFYRCSKQASETYVEEYQKKYGLDYTIVRYGSLYGPRTDETNGVYRLLKNYIDNKTIEHSGRSNDKRDYIHVYDAARLSTKMLEEEFVNKNIILTGNDTLQVSELFKMFEEILNMKKEVVFLGDEGRGNGHYNITPYAYTPKLGKKLISPEYVDMGQGLIQLVEEIMMSKQKEE